MNKTYCQGTSKRSWPNKSEAEKGLAKIWRMAYKGGPGKLPLRTYQCHICKEWHLTSKPLSHYQK